MRPPAYAPEKNYTRLSAVVYHDMYRSGFLESWKYVVEVLASILGRGQRKFPPAIENFRARAKETHRVIPPAHDREAIGNFAIAAAKSDGDRTIRAFYRGVAIDRIGFIFVRFNITLRVVDGERPKTIDGHVSNC